MNLQAMVRIIKLSGWSRNQVSGPAQSQVLNGWSGLAQIIGTLECGRETTVGPYNRDRSDLWESITDTFILISLIKRAEDKNPKHLYH